MHADSGITNATAMAAGGKGFRLNRALLVVVALLLASVLVFWPSIEALAILWSHPERRTYQHGYLISALALWLLYRLRHRLAAASANPAPALLILAAAGSLCWLVAYKAGLQIVHLLLWPAILWSAATSVLGLRAGAVLLVPVVYFYFALPVWDTLVPLLQYATVFANQLMGSVFGVPMLIEGTFVHIPEGTFEIAGGCSGLNYFIVGVAVAALLGEINRDAVKRRVVLLALGGGLAIVSNWLRVFIIIYAGHVSDMTHYLVRVDHYNFGWVLYAFALGAFFLIARRLPNASFKRVPSANIGSPAAPRTLAVLAAFSGLALGWLVAGATSLRHSITNEDAVRIGIADVDDRRFENWQPAPALGEWIPIFPGADGESLVDYSSSSGNITVYTATYLRQAQGRELIGYDSRVQGVGSGSFVRRDIRTLPGRPTVKAIEAEWRSTTGNRVVLWWAYRVGSRDFVSNLGAQLWYGLASLWSEPVSAIVAMRAECRPDCEAARSALQEFAGEALLDMLDAASRTGVSLE